MGRSPYPFPLDKINEYVECLEGTRMNIVLPKTDIRFTVEQGVHSHDSYEFLMPLKPMPYIGCGDMNIYVPKDTILPINAGQKHGPNGDMLACIFIAIHVEREFLCEVYQNMYGSPEAVFLNEPLPVSHELLSLINRFSGEARKPLPGQNLMIESLSVQIVVQLLRDFTETGSDVRRNGKSKDKPNLGIIMEYFKENYQSNGYSTVKAARMANMSTFQFIRSFRKETGKTPYEFLMDLRLKKATELLLTGKSSITEICFICGFTNHSHFTTTFRKKLGMSPSEYRKKNST